MKTTLNRLIQHETLTKEEAKTVLVNISTNHYNPSQIATFLILYIMLYMMLNNTIEELFRFRDSVSMIAGLEFKTQST